MVVSWWKSFWVVSAFTLVFSAFAFQWTPFEFPAGDQSYTLEVRTSSAGESDQVITIDVDVTEQNGLYNIDTRYNFNQTGVSFDDLGEAVLGGSMFGMFAFGPMMMYGPSFMFLPMMLGNEDISVRSEPMRVMGMGRVYMDEAIEVAGRECVVIRLELDESPDDPVEFALAEDLPFPCYSRYGDDEGGFVEVRLIRAE